MTLSKMHLTFFETAAMKMQDSVDLEINGERVRDCTPTSLIVDILRNDLRLLGTKKSCETGTCGACTILTDGLPALSCKLFAGSASGQSLTTIEALASDPESARLIEAFTSPDFPGCGDCLSGFIISAKALLEADPAPSVFEIKLALSGHLCRCVGHEFFIEAVSKAANKIKADSASRETAPQPAGRLPFGKTTSIQDALWPGLLEAAVLGSRFAGTTIAGIDTRRARLAPGVVAILTAEDFATGVIFKLRPPSHGSLLATSASYVGEPAAIAVADTLEHAKHALSLIEVEYATAPASERPQKAEFTDGWDHACAPSHDSSNAVACGVTRALVASGGAVASWQGNRLSLLTPAAPNRYEHGALFGSLLPGLDELQTEWSGIAPANGGPFDSRANDAALAVVSSLLLDRPVRVHPHADGLGFRPAQILISTAPTYPHGQLKSVAVEVDADTRPTAPSTCPPETNGAQPEPQRKVTYELTTKTPGTVLIDHSSEEIAFCIQQSLDMAAREHQQDPLAFRLSQVQDPTTAKTLADAATAFGWHAKWRGWTHASIERRRRGVGLAFAGQEAAGAARNAVAVFVEVEVDADIGTISLGACTVLVMGADLESRARLAAQTGFAHGVETALVREATPVDDLGEAPATGHYLSRSMTTLDAPQVEYIFTDGIVGTQFSFQGVSDQVGAAVVGALANAVRDATGLLPTTLPMTVDRVRWSTTGEAAAGQNL